MRTVRDCTSHIFIFFTLLVWTKLGVFYNRASCVGKLYLVFVIGVVCKAIFGSGVIYGGIKALEGTAVEDWANEEES